MISHTNANGIKVTRVRYFDTIDDADDPGADASGIGFSLTLAASEGGVSEVGSAPEAGAGVISLQETTEVKSSQLFTSIHSVKFVRQLEVIVSLKISLHADVFGSGENDDTPS